MGQCRTSFERARLGIHVMSGEIKRPPAWSPHSAHGVVVRKGALNALPQHHATRALHAACLASGSEFFKDAIACRFQLFDIFHAAHTFELQEGETLARFPAECSQKGALIPNLRSACHLDQSAANYCTFVVLGTFPLFPVPSYRNVRAGQIPRDQPAI